MTELDDRALQVARMVQRRERPDLTILFGSRSRGDHDGLRSDIDIMLVQRAEPGPDGKQLATEAAKAFAAEAYGRAVPVQLVWRTLDEFRFNRRYVNSVETNAVRDGVIMPRDQEGYSASRYEDEENEYEYDWSNYRERIRHAEAHLRGFIIMSETGADDILIGQQAQNTLEHGMKALIAAAEGKYSNTHSISELLGNIRYFDEEMRDFRLSIPPDVYTEYEGEAEYRQRRQPELTSYSDYLERTSADALRIIERAKELFNRANRQ